MGQVPVDLQVKEGENRQSTKGRQGDEPPGGENRSRGAHSHQPTRCGRMVVKKRLQLRDAIELGNAGSHRSDSEREWCNVTLAVHNEQHGGVVRIVAHQCGWLSCRVGEATKPGPSLVAGAPWQVGMWHPD